MGENSSELMGLVWEQNKIVPSVPCALLSRALLLAVRTRRPFPKLLCPSQGLSTVADSGLLVASSSINAERTHLVALGAEHFHPPALASLAQGC